MQELQNNPVRHYRFGGVSLALTLPEEWTPSPRLELFRTEPSADAHRVRVELVSRIAEPRGELVARLPELTVYRTESGFVRYSAASNKGWDTACFYGEQPETTLCLKRVNRDARILAMSVLNALGAEHLVIRAGGVILHASFIVWRGRAVLFTAPSGTGKSTQADLWKQHMGVEIINGDRAVMQMEGEQPLACGLPFAGSSGICQNVTVPLGAVVYLSQAEETSIRKLTGFRAFRRIWEGCSINTWDREDMTLAADLVNDLLGRVPVYHLACTPDESAVLALKKELEKQEGWVHA